MYYSSRKVDAHVCSELYSQLCGVSSIVPVFYVCKPYSHEYSSNDDRTAVCCFLSAVCFCYGSFAADVFFSFFFPNNTAIPYMMCGRDASHVQRSCA